MSKVSNANFNASSHLLYSMLYTSSAFIITLKLLNVRVSMKNQHKIVDDRLENANNLPKVL